MTAAIRAVDPDTLVFYEPHVLFNNGVNTFVTLGGDAHAGFSFHDYCLTAPAPGCDVFDDLVFANADGHAVSEDVVPLLTEFGATRSPEVLEPMTERADRTMIGWQVWHYCGCDDPTTSGPGRRAGARVRPGSGAGGFESGRGEAVDLVAAVSVGGGGDAGVVVLQQRHLRGQVVDRWIRRRGRVRAGASRARAFPDGYSAAVEGARVVSRPAPRCCGWPSAPARPRSPSSGQVRQSE